jgi:general nucleoside transport system ATP-binding protein
MADKVFTGMSHPASSPAATNASATSPVAVEMRGISKRFGTVQANRQVDFSVQAGHIHGLVGENGAGKSTLMSILYGFYAADAGEILLHGQSVQIRTAQDAIAQGVGMVHQHFMLVDNMTALENVMLGAEGHWELGQAAKQAQGKLQALMQRTGLHVPLDRTIQDLSVGDCQRLEILKALYRGARILILDEPTAVLTPQETLQLFEVLGKLREQGTTIIIITHKLKEVMHICDCVTVMRAGQVVHHTRIADTHIEALAQAMIGRTVSTGRSAPNAQSASGEVLLSAQDLSLRDMWGVTRLDRVSLMLRAGEIVGVAGVAGNGQSELLDVLSGMSAPDQGQLRLGERSFSDKNHWLHPALARQLGLAHIPENRHGRAMVMPFAAWESAVLGYQTLPSNSGTFWMRHGAMRERTAAMMQRFDVRPQQVDLRCAQFSGGNQQKQVIGRELGQQPRVLLIGQPTRGVDIGAIEFIHAQIRALRDEGCAVLLVSSELDEILALSDRVLVMNQGHITGELGIDECDETRLGMLMASSGTGPDTRSAA